MRAERIPTEHGWILRVLLGCDYCGSAEVETDPDGLICCADCGLTALDEDQ